MLENNPKKKHHRDLKGTCLIPKKKQISTSNHPGLQRNHLQTRCGGPTCGGTRQRHQRHSMPHQKPRTLTPSTEKRLFMLWPQLRMSQNWFFLNLFGLKGYPTQDGRSRVLEFFWDTQKLLDESNFFQVPRTSHESWGTWRPSCSQEAATGHLFAEQGLGPWNKADHHWIQGQNPTIFDRKSIGMVDVCIENHEFSYLRTFDPSLQSCQRCDF